eukprot:4389387-Pyramimonas_sp.AAC.1
MQATQLMAATVPTPMAFHPEWGHLVPTSGDAQVVVLAAVVGIGLGYAPPHRRIGSSLLSRDW